MAEQTQRYRVEIDDDEAVAAQSRINAAFDRGERAARRFAESASTNLERLRNIASRSANTVRGVFDSIGNGAERTVKVIGAGLALWEAWRLTLGRVSSAMDNQSAFTDRLVDKYRNLRFGLASVLALAERSWVPLLRAGGSVAAVAALEAALRATYERGADIEHKAFQATRIAAPIGDIAQQPRNEQPLFFRTLREDRQRTLINEELERRFVQVQEGSAIAKFSRLDEDTIGKAIAAALEQTTISVDKRTDRGDVRSGGAVFGDVARQIGDITDPLEKADTITRIFGQDLGEKLFPVLNRRIQENADTFREWGGVLSQTEAQDMARFRRDLKVFGDEIAAFKEKAKAGFEGFKIAVESNIASAYARLAEFDERFTAAAEQAVQRGASGRFALPPGVQPAERILTPTEIIGTLRGENPNNRRDIVEASRDVRSPQTFESTLSGQLSAQASAVATAADRARARWAQSRGAIEKARTEAETTRAKALELLTLGQTVLDAKGKPIGVRDLTPSERFFQHLIVNQSDNEAQQAKEKLFGLDVARAQAEQTRASRQALRVERATGPVAQVIARTEVQLENATTKIDEDNVVRRFKLTTQSASAETQRLALEVQKIWKAEVQNAINEWSTYYQFRIGKESELFQKRLDTENEILRVQNQTDEKRLQFEEFTNQSRRDSQQRAIDRTSFVDLSSIERDRDVQTRAIDLTQASEVNVDHPQRFAERQVQVEQARAVVATQFIERSSARKLQTEQDKLGSEVNFLGVAGSLQDDEIRRRSEREITDFRTTRTLQLQDLDRRSALLRARALEPTAEGQAAREALPSVEAERARFIEQTEQKITTIQANADEDRRQNRIRVADSIDRTQEDAATRQVTIQLDAQRAIEAAQQESVIRQTQYLRDAYERQFNAIKDSAGHLFDAAFTGAKNFADAARRLLIAGLLTPVREAFSTNIAKLLTPKPAGVPVPGSLISGGVIPGGGIPGLTTGTFTGKPINLNAPVLSEIGPGKVTEFPKSKLEQPGHLGDVSIRNGAVPVFITNQSPAERTASQTLGKTAAAIGAIALTLGSAAPRLAAQTLPTAAPPGIVSSAINFGDGAVSTGPGVVYGGQAGSLPVGGSLLRNVIGGGSFSPVQALSPLGGGIPGNAVANQALLPFPGFGNVAIPGAPGGTSGFAGPAGIGGSLKSGIAGYAGQLKNFFGFGSQSVQLAPGVATTTASFGGKLAALGKSDAALLGGGLLALNGLRQGGFGGLAQTTAGGALIGFRFGGPVGAAIGAAAGATAGIVRLFIKGMDEKVRERIKTVYAVDVSDKGILKQITNTIRQGFGGNIDVGIRSPQVRELIQLYAANTGQRFPLQFQPRPVVLTQKGGVLYQSAGSYENGRGIGFESRLPQLGSFDIAPRIPAYAQGGIVKTDQLAMVHKDEMVLPRELSTGIQSLITHLRPLRPQTTVVNNLPASKSSSTNVRLPAYEYGGIVRSDQLAMVHRDEMVLPRELSRGLQQMISWMDQPIAYSSPTVHQSSAASTAELEAVIAELSAQVRELAQRPAQPVKVQVGGTVEVDGMKMGRFVQKNAIIAVADNPQVVTEAARSETQANRGRREHLRLLASPQTYIG